MTGSTRMNLHLCAWLTSATTHNNDLIPDTSRLMWDGVLWIGAAVGNGGRTEKYEWTQTLQELSVVVPVPEGSKSRDVVCDITKSRLRVGLKGQPLLVDVSSSAVILERKSWERVLLPSPGTHGNNAGAVDDTLGTDLILKFDLPGLLQPRDTHRVWV